MIDKKLQKLRKSGRMTQEKAAKGIISPKQYSAYETGRSIPSKEILCELAKRFQVPSSYLVDYDKDEPKLHSLLIRLSESLVSSDIDRAKKLLTTIKESFPLIPSYSQEMLFLLLQTVYDLQLHDYNHAQLIFDSEIVPYIDEGWLSSNLMHLRHYLYIQARISLYHQKYHESHRYFLKLLEFVKDDVWKADIHFNLALVFSKQKNFDKAIHLAETSMILSLHERKPKDIPHIYHLLGYLHLEKKDYHTAERFFKNALFYGEQSLSTLKKGKILYKLGIIYKELKRFDEAIDVFTNSLREFGDHPDACRVYESLTQYYLEKGDLDRVRSLIEEVQGRECSDEDKHHLKVVEAKYELRMGNLKRYEKLLEEAAQYFEEQQNWEKLKDIAKELGEYYVENKAYKKAVIYFTKAINDIQKGDDTI